MLFQKQIIFRYKKLPQNFAFISTYKFDEFFLDFEIAKQAFSINVIHQKANTTTPKGVVFYLHGTLNNIQYHLSKTTFFLEQQYDVIIMDYPQYGKSKGVLKEDLLYDVVENVYCAMFNKIQNSGPVFIVGRSLGTALASNLASKVSASGLILISPYSNMPDLFSQKVKLFSFEKLKFKLENNVYLPMVKSDAYILHGTDDTLIPIALAHKLIPFLKHPDRFVSIDKANHFNIHEKDEFKTFVASILNSIK